MSPLVVPIVDTVGKVIDDLVTTEEERRAMDLEERKLDQSLSLGQIDVNKAEASHASIFVAGWRPFIGWVCGVALAAVYIPKALVMTALWVYAACVVVGRWSGIGDFPALPAFPDLGVADLLALVGGMLGMATLRTVETAKGVARENPLTRIFKKAPVGPQGEGP